MDEIATVVWHERFAYMTVFFLALPYGWLHLGEGGRAGGIGLLKLGRAAVPLFSSFLLRLLGKAVTVACAAYKERVENRSDCLVTRWGEW